jgi:hypothetical protein
MRLLNIMNLDLGNNQDIPITVIRTDRKKTVSIKIIEGNVHVIVPKTLSDRKIHQFVQQKANWIRQRLHQQQAIKPFKPKKFVSGEAFAYLGRNYRLELYQGDPGEVKLKHGRFVLLVPESLKGDDRAEYIKTQLIRWYVDHANQQLREKSQRYARLIGVSPKSVTVKHYKSRWGSCSIHGDVFYNWRIIMAPHRIVDYLVVHELCHLKHHNHSPRYWRNVEVVMPDHLECRDWLKNNGTSINF